jgi:MFS family permease
MSKLHSIYAWGAVAVIIISTVFLLVFGGENWAILTLFFALVPFVSALLFAGSEIPKMETPEKVSGALKMLKNSGVWLCVFAIFLGGAAECTMAQWCSSYLEKAMNIPKVWGDLFGVALFSLMLGLGRTLYAKIGRNIGQVLTLGAIGAAVCYLIAALSNIPLVGLIACAFTGFCTSMLWPGNLVVASSRFPESGVFIYAMMAAGGDLGASVAPQLVGLITDTAIATPLLVELASTLNLSPDQFGMKLGMLCGMLFPLVGIFIYLHIWESNRSQKFSGETV